MPESKVPPYRQLLTNDGRTEIIFPDAAFPQAQSISVLSAHDETCVAIVMTRFPGEMRPVALDGDDAQAMALRLLELAEDTAKPHPDRVELANLIDHTWAGGGSPRDIADELLERFAVVRRREE